MGEEVKRFVPVILSVEEPPKLRRPTQRASRHELVSKARPTFLSSTSRRSPQRGTVSSTRFASVETGFGPQQRLLAMRGGRS